MKLFLMFLMGLACIMPGAYLIGYRNGVDNDFVYNDHLRNQQLDPNIAKAPAAPPSNYHWIQFWR